MFKDEVTEEVTDDMRARITGAAAAAKSGRCRLALATPTVASHSTLRQARRRRAAIAARKLRRASRWRATSAFEV